MYRMRLDFLVLVQDKPRLELTEKIEADFYSQDVAGAKPQEPPENKTPVATKITGKMILEAIPESAHFCTSPAHFTKKP